MRICYFWVGLFGSCYLGNREMKKFFQFVEYLLFVVRYGWRAPCLAKDIELLEIQVDSLHRALAQKNQQIEELKRQPDEQTARSMLMQLRIHQESVRQRTGYMVSAFIAQGVVAKLAVMGPEKQKQFAAVVAEVLVHNALNGILKRSAATSKLTALVFAPITKRGQNVQLVGGIFETDEQPEFVSMNPNVPSYKQLPDRPQGNK